MVCDALFRGLINVVFAVCCAAHKPTSTPATLSPQPAPIANPLATMPAQAQAKGDTAKVEGALGAALTAPHLGIRTSQMTCQLATSLSALQVNLKTQDWQRIALLTGWGCTYRGAVPMGAAVYVGFGMSTKAPTAFQTAILFNVFDWGAIGPGVQMFLSPVDGRMMFQGLLTVSLNLNIGVSVDTLLKLGQLQPGEASVRVPPMDTSP
jgi:hypothetical protein